MNEKNQPILKKFRCKNDLEIKENDDFLGNQTPLIWQKERA